MAADHVVAGAIVGLTTALEANHVSLLSALGAINANLIALNAQLEKSIGLSALAEPGSLRNSIANQADMLVNISDSLMKIEEGQSNIVANITDVAGAVKAQAATMSDMVAVQSVAAADQIANNSFQKQETLAALKRNDIQPAPLPTIQEMVQEAINNSGIMRATTEFQNAVSSVTNSIFDKLKDYIMNSALVVWSKEVLTNMWTALGFNKAQQVIKDPVAVAAKQAKSLSQIRAKTGVWSPGTIPPETWT